MTEATCAERIKSQLYSRLEDITAYNTLSHDWEDQPTDQDAQILDRLGDPYNYGLSFELESRNYRTGSVVFRWLLSWGGPADWFDISVSVEGDDEITNILYDFQDWGDNATTEDLPVNLDPVEEFVTRFMYIDVQQAIEPMTGFTPTTEELQKLAELALRDLATATGAVFQVRAFKREDLFTAANGGRAAKSELVMEVFPYKGDKK